MDVPLSVEWRWRAWAELTRDELYALLALRQAVFVVEQDCAYQDADGYDAEARHLLGWRDGALVAYLRTFAPGVQRPQAAIGRVITAATVRGQGLGDPLMWAGLEGLFERAGGPVPCFVSAQAHLEGWYGRLGFRVSGPSYDEDGIPHLPMIRPAIPVPR